MKKLSSTCYNMAIVLTVIAVIAGSVLAFVNKATTDVIAQINAENEAKAIKDVLVDESTLITDTIVGEDGITLFVANNGSVAVKSVDPQNASFGGDLTIMVGFSAEGNILGYSILKSNETPGLGAKADAWFQQDGPGSIIGLNPGTNKVGVKQDGGEVDAITASTITSRAFLRAVVAAYKKAVEDGCIDGAVAHDSYDATNDLDSDEYNMMSGSDEADGETAATAQEGADATTAATN